MFVLNDKDTTEIYTLSLHDALPISRIERHAGRRAQHGVQDRGRQWLVASRSQGPDRKSTRLNSSHTVISYAVFCWKKKKRPRCGGREDAWPPPPTAGVP